MNIPMKTHGLEKGTSLGLGKGLTALALKRAGALALQKGLDISRQQKVLENKLVSEDWHSPAK